jgi:hypothetical protein
MRDDLVVNDKSRMLLVVSMATDEIIRNVTIYPDVCFMDTAADQSYFCF